MGPGVVPVQILDGRFSPTGDCFAVTDSRGYISLYGEFGSLILSRQKWFWELIT